MIVKKASLLLLAFFLINICQAQISSVDTTSINVPVSFTCPVRATSYSWIFDTASTNPSFSTPAPIFTPSTLNTPDFSVMVNDNGHWYCFLTDRGTNEVLRLDYGANPNGTFTTSSISGFGFSNTELEGIEIVKDSITNNWYGFIVNDAEIVRMSFGTSLSNTPSYSLMSFPTYLSFSHQISIKKIGSQWIGFVANRDAQIVRLDFGTSITNVPTCTSIPTVGSYASVCNFALYQQAGNWYMFVSNLLSNTFSRLEFGPDIQNNTPTGTAYGNIGGNLNIPRGILCFKSCNQLKVYIFNESGACTQLDYGNNILDTPVATSFGSFGITGINAPSTYTYKDTVYFDIVSFSGIPNLYKVTALGYPHPDTTTYYNDSITHTFTTPGLHDVTLYCDQACPTGPSTYCKQVYVRSQVGVPKVQRSEDKIVLFPNPAQDNITIKLEGNVSKNAVAELYDIKGLYLGSYTLTREETTITTISLANGVYICKITNGNNSSAIKRIIIQR